jgi:hypothetical protein
LEEWTTDGQSDGQAMGGLKEWDATKLVEKNITKMQLPIFVFPSLEVTL